MGSEMCIRDRVVVVLLTEYIKQRTSDNCDMLERKDHAGGEESCWRERIMLAEKDHVGEKGSCWFRKMMRNAEMWFSHPKHLLFHKTARGVSVRNINRSKLYVSSPPTC